MLSGPREIRRLLGWGLTLVTGAGLIAELVHAGSGDVEPSYAVGLLSLSYEANLPTWYASGLLLACAVALFAAARVEQAPGQRRYWRALGGIFVLMSLDETVEMHERMTGTFDLDGVFHYDWLLFGAGFAAVVGLVCIPFLRRLPAKSARAFVVAGAVYVTGAVGFELPLGWWAGNWGEDNLTFGLIDWMEESLELAGASLFLWALLPHAGVNKATLPRL